VKTKTLIDLEECLELLGAAEQDAALEDECEAETIRKCIRLIKGIQTVNAAGVPQGHWEEYMPYVDKNPKNRTVKNRCSVCKAPASPFMTMFCQECGAQLRRDCSG